jgi:hypothetical protein
MTDVLTDALRTLRLRIGLLPRGDLCGDSALDFGDSGPAVNRRWNGSEHVRRFRIEGERLEIVTAWEPVSPRLGGPLRRGVMVWERSK